MAIGTNFSVTGSATATVGYDIDDEQFGFKNESSSDISIGFVWCTNEASMADENEDGMIGGKFGNCTVNNSDKVGSSGWVGTIELKEFRVIIDSNTFGDDEDSPHFVKTGERYEGNPYVTGTTTPSEAVTQRSGLFVDPPTIVAKLQNGPLYVQIFDMPASKADLVGHIEDDKDGDNAAESNDDKQDVGLDLDWQGLTFGYTTADLSIAVGVASEYPYDNAPVADDPATKIVVETKAEEVGSHAVSAVLNVNVGPAKLDVAFVQGLEASTDADAADDDPDDDTGIGAKLTTDFGSVALSAGADVRMTGEDDDETTDTNEAMSFDAGGTATVTLTPNTSLVSKFIHSTNSTAATDVEVVLSDKSGLVEDLSLGVTWGLFDIVGGEKDAQDVLANDQSDLFLQASLGYAIHLDDGMDDDDMMMKGPTLTPSTKVTINQIDGGDATVGFEIQALLEHAIPATTFGLKWKTAQLLDTDTKSAKQGVVTLWSKIKY
jgi:hypothetical protein